MHGYIRRKVTRAIKKGPGVSSSGGTPGHSSNGACVIPIPPVGNVEVAYLVKGEEWQEITFDYAEQKNLKWSGVIPFEGYIRHLFVE